jgi:predicted CXXCH cytochrome family protein
VAAKPDSSTESERQVISPLDRAVLMSGRIDVIIKSPDGKLEVDGEPCAAEPFQSPLQVKRLWLDPGMHEIRAGDQRVEFVVALNEIEHDGPSDWKIVRSHPIEPGDDRCGVCHETERKDGLLEVIGIPSDETCLDCHTASKVEAIHPHAMELVQSCRLCHVIHGSLHKRLLKAPAKDLCDQCHGS